MMLYITYVNLNAKGYVGIKKKVAAQCRVFQKEFGTVYCTMFTGQMVYLLQEDKVIDKEFAITLKECNEILLQWIEKYNVERTYIRYHISDMWFVDFLKELKSRNIISILEFPTIPYDGENWIRRPEEDHYYREQLCKYIDCCTTFANYKDVFGIPCISMINGIDLEQNKVNSRKPHKQDITLIAVATMRREHGYERIIQGIQMYYKAGGVRKVYLKLVGDGSQISYYERLVKEFELEEYISFYGIVQGKEFDKIYEEADLGIGALGTYKSGVNEGAGIKVFEYCARGLPIIYDNMERILDKQYFAMKVVSDASPIDIRKVINFYDSLQDKDYITDMRNYAIKNLSWDKVLEPVVDYYKSKKVIVEEDVV